MKKTIIWSFVLFLLAFAFQVNAGIMNSSDPRLIYWGAFDDASGVLQDNKTRIDLMQINLSVGTGATPLYQQAGLVNYSQYSVDFDGSTDYFFNRSINDHIGFQDVTVALWIRADTVNVQHLAFSTFSSPVGWYLKLVDYGGGDLRWYCAFYDDGVEKTSENGANSNPSKVFLACIFNSTTVALYTNGTKASTTTSITPSASDKGLNFSIGKETHRNLNYHDGRMDELTVWNGSLSELELRHLMTYGVNNTIEGAPDTAPPEINTNSYNMTSEGGAGCINWRTNKSNQCSTSDATPTVAIKTNEPASCAIGLEDKNLSYYNGLAVNRSCENGGTQSLICTLRPQDELVYEDSTIYISCNDTAGNENSTSTSGALKLSITGLEAAGRNFIGLGIQNALSSGYTNYTDLQIYARNLANNQTKGTFDRAAKKGSKMWAFNRIGVSDSHVNMFNLTPVLYTLEFANKTSTQITNQVELLINATK